ncbi:MAG: PHP domain-containing protein [Firmicutes bacterium]|nr:PHP domain-containing protein [Bacillota bacterium]HPU00499.1 CehA/McbA family metallohydrolase [Bacillota bacterium]
MRMRIDLHVHTAYSDDAYGEPEEVLAAAVKAGLDGLAITEHGNYEKSEIFLKLAPRFNLAVFVGAEVATRSGHLLVFSDDIGRWNRFKGENNDAQEVIDAVNSAGGAVVAAHPYRVGHGCGSAAKLSGLAAIESCNGANQSFEDQLAWMLAEKLSLPCTGGSDAHFTDEIGRCYTLFTVPVRTMSDLVAALKAGHCTAVDCR